MSGRTASVRPALSLGGSNLSPVLLLMSACAVLLLAVVAAVVTAGPISPRWVVAMSPLAGGIWLAAGVVALFRRPSNRVGAILVGGGLVIQASALSNSAVPMLVAIGQVLATTPLAVVVHLLMAFPSGRLRDARSRVLVALAYATAVVLGAPAYMFTVETPPFDPLLVADAPDIALVGAWVQRGFGAAVMAATATSLVVRLRAATTEKRRVLLPLYGYGVAAILFIPISGTVLQPAGVLTPIATFLLQIAVVALVPIAFVGSLLRGGFARTAEVQELGAWLGADVEHRPRLRDALSATLGDPSLELAYWTPSGCVDAAGDAVTLPDSGDDRDAIEITLGPANVGAIIYDTTVVTDPELVRNAGRVIALALDRERLTAELRASQESLRQSRRRLVEAHDRRQERIARDLHDGLQNRLVVLAIEANRSGVTDVRVGIEAAIADLRALVAGIVPPMLLDRGLAAATRDLVDRMPLPVELDVTGLVDGLPPTVEQTAYFVLSEALTNAIKHSRARELSVRLDQTPRHLRLEIRDDGVGGAELATGRGLRGLADRVDVAGGRLKLRSPNGGGTLLVAELPCVW